ncbi:MAG: quinolinate synthase NadA [Ignavibacteriae bacterium]|nr:quinolinate synthase NadA [Ignavibacteriota bacterium]
MDESRQKYVPHTLTTQEYYRQITRLKKEKNAVILSHYYMIPEIQLLIYEGGIADFLGDSLGLSLEATKVEQQNIVFCGVNFMAETAKILSPTKNVYIPDKLAGCSLASSITKEDVRNLRKQYPGVPVIAYVNTYAETKAECDVCCTSRNALSIAKSFKEDTLIFLPDKFMGENLRRRIYAETGKKLILWNGTCEVHEQFKSDSFTSLKAEHPDAKMLLHWEVPEQTVQENISEMGGILGSTNDIINYVSQSKDQTFILASECDLGSTLKRMFTGKEFITPCVKCSYMKMITLDSILRTLQSIGTAEERFYEIALESNIIKAASIPVKRMLQYN